MGIERSRSGYVERYPRSYDLFMASDGKNSTDGLTWNNIGTSLPTMYGQTVAYGNGTFVTVPYSTTIREANYTKDNGASWSSSTLPAAGYWYGIKYGSNRFVTIAYSWSTQPGPFAAYSSDGITWVQSTLPAITKQWRQLETNGTQFVVVATGGQFCAVSTNGIAWTQYTIPYSSYWNYQEYLNGSYIFGYDKALIYSTNGITWTTATVPYAGGQVGFSTVGKDKIAILFGAPSLGGQSLRGVASSNDLANWNIVSVDAPESEWSPIVFDYFSDNFWMIWRTSIPRTYVVQKSPDAISWTSTTITYASNETLPPTYPGNGGANSALRKAIAAKLVPIQELL